MNIFEGIRNPMGGFARSCALGASLSIKMIAQNSGNKYKNIIYQSGNRLAAAESADPETNIAAAISKVDMPIGDGTKSGIVESVDSTNFTFTVAEKPISRKVNPVILSWQSLLTEKNSVLPYTPVVEKEDVSNVVVKVVTPNGASPTHHYTHTVLLRYPHPSKP